jgi:hypothetical protein
MRRDYQNESALSIKNFEKQMNAYLTGIIHRRSASKTANRTVNQNRSHLDMDDQHSINLNIANTKLIGNTPSLS